MNTRSNSITGVYKIKNIINEKQYVGSSSEHIPKRWRLHNRMLRNNNHHSVYLQRAWNKHGKNNFVFEIIEYCSPEICLDREQFYIDLLKPEYNICLDARSPKGRIVSEKTREKLRIKFSGKNNPFYGKTHSKESLKMMSDSLKGKLKGVMVGEKNPMFGKTHTVENRDIMSKKSKSFWETKGGILLRNKLSEEKTGRTNIFALKGKNHPKYNPTIFNFINEKTNESFSGTVLDFRKKYNLCGDVYYLIHRKYKQYKGWILNEKM